MRNFKTLCISLMFLGTSAFAGTKEEAVQVVERWAKAFTEADVDTIVSLYASDAVFIGTSSKMIVSTSASVKAFAQRSTT